MGFQWKNGLEKSVEKVPLQDMNYPWNSKIRETKIYKAKCEQEEKSHTTKMIKVRQ